MAHDVAGDRRIDPRIKALLEPSPTSSRRRPPTREELLAEANTPRR